MQARATHTPTQICAQPYHATSSSHGQLFGNIGVHQHERGKSASAEQRVQSASSTQHMWEGGSWVGVCVPLALSFSFENSELNCSTA